MLYSAILYLDSSNDTSNDTFFVQKLKKKIFLYFILMSTKASFLLIKLMFINKQYTV